MDVLLKILQLILALSTLIFIHELGHFLWARIFGIRVEKFYLFFDVGGKSLFKFKKGETEFGIGWLPLGGYCKISGMVDESMDLEQLRNEPQNWEFRSHPAWQRLVVMAGGVVNNFIFAILTYICIMAIWGQAYIGNRGSKIYVNDLSYEMGFRTGDEILRLDDYTPTNFAMLQADMVRRDAGTATVLRGKDTVSIYIDHAMIGDVLNSDGIFDLAIPFVVDSILAGGPNANGNIRKGDRIIALGGKSVEYLQDARDILSDLSMRDIEALVVRGADTVATQVRVDSTGRIGVSMAAPNIIHNRYNILSAIPAGWNLAVQTVGGYLKDLKLVAKPSTGAYKSVGSFIAIGQVFPSAWDSYQFLQILALLSIILAVMNLLPIPGLDGGHMVFVLYEMITGRKPSDRFLSIMQIIGLTIIVLLMVLAFGNDIGRLLR